MGHIGNDSELTERTMFPEHSTGGKPEVVPQTTGVGGQDGVADAFAELRELEDRRELLHKIAEQVPG